MSSENGKFDADPADSQQTLVDPHHMTCGLVVVLAAVCSSVNAYHVETVGVRHTRLRNHMKAKMFFDLLKGDKKGDPVEVVVKTFDGDITVQGFQGGEMIKAMEQSGVIFGCKEGTCGTCEVKLEGRVVRSW